MNKKNLPTMTKVIYRVECNNGSKYFNHGIEAFYYYEDMCAVEPSMNVELWLLIKELSPKRYCVSQEIIAYRSVGGRIKPDKAYWH